MMPAKEYVKIRTGAALIQSRITPSRSVGAILFVVGFAILFLLLRSQQYLAVDGPLRCLQVFHDPSTRLHGNNHMLYPFWMWLWTRTAGLAGVAAPDWLSFIHLCQALNAFAAAATIGMLYTILHTVAGARFAILGSLQYGLSTAVMLHGTNSAEPMMGLLFAVGALALLTRALRADNKSLLFLVGVLLALALASYEAMALAAPLVAFACACWPGSSEQPRWHLAIVRLLTVGAGGLLSVLVIYYLAYSSVGVPPSGMVARFFALGGASEVYGHFSPTKAANIPFGLVRNLYNGVPDNYAGIRSVFKDPRAAFWVSTILLGLGVLAIIALLTASNIISAAQRWTGSKALLWSGILLSLLAMFFPLVYWSSIYDKLWLLPLAAAAIAVAFAWRFSDQESWRRRWLAMGLSAIVIAEAAVNIPHAVYDHVHETAHLNEARAFAARITPQDSVVIDFDSISMLWLAIWGYGEDCLTLPASTQSETAAWLANMEESQRTRKGKLFFIGVLDHDRKDWDAFLGGSVGIPYNEFDCYRQKAVPVSRYSYFHNFVTIRELDAPSGCAP
jgi:hypothetical protein